MKKIILSGLILLLPLSAAAQQQRPPAKAAAPAPAKGAPVISASVDRTAIWVGDVLRYTLRVVHDPNVELVLDNFTKDRLPLAPFTVRDIDIRRGEWAAGKQAAEITLLLSTLETGRSDVTIPPVQLFYFVRDTGLTKKESPVETIAAPAIKVGMGSTVVTDNPVPRAGNAANPPGLAWALMPLALGFAGFLSLAGYGGLRMWQRMHPEDAGRQMSREARERIVQEWLARLRAGLSTAGDDPRQWSGAMAAALRGLVGDLHEISGVALTPEEAEAALTRSGTDAHTAAQVKTILMQCDQLRYGKQSVGTPALRAQLQQSVERLMTSPQLLSA
jgi:hypothetical protein